MSSDFGSASRAGAIYSPCEREIVLDVSPHESTATQNRLRVEKADDELTRAYLALTIPGFKS